MDLLDVYPKNFGTNSSGKFAETPGKLVKQFPGSSWRKFLRTSGEIPGEFLKEFLENFLKNFTGTPEEFMGTQGTLGLIPGKLMEKFSGNS